MSQFQNTNVVFRCPAGLKAKMRAYAEANEQHLSSFIRFACSDFLRREMGEQRPTIPTEDQINKHLEEIVG